MFYFSVFISSNNTFLLSNTTLDIQSIDTNLNLSNESFCLSTNQSSAPYIHKTKFILKFEKNSTKTQCIQLG